jgi:hypothetical protein
MHMGSAKREAERTQASAVVELETLRRRLADADEERASLAKALTDAKEAAQTEIAKASAMAQEQAQRRTSNLGLEQELAALKDKLGRKGRSECRQT